MFDRIKALGGTIRAVGSPTIGHYQWEQDFILSRYGKPDIGVFGIADELGVDPNAVHAALGGRILVPTGPNSTEYRTH